MIRRVVAAGALAGIVVLAGAPAARAHALLASSQPADGAQVASAPSEVTLTFTEPPDVTLCVVHVLDTSGAQREKGKPALAAGKPKTVRVETGALGRGVFTVTWRVVSKVDGHVTAGAFAFGVGEAVGDVKPRQIATPRPTVVSVVSRALYYAGLFLLIGAALSALFLFGVTSAGAQLARTGITLAVLGVAGLAEEQWHASGAALSAFARSALGRQVAWRAGPLVLAVVVFAVARLRKRWVSGIAGAAGAASFLAHVAAGHAGVGRLRWLAIGVQWVHVIAAATWIGGLVALVAGVRRTRDAATPGDGEGGARRDEAGSDAAAVARVRAVRRYSGLALYLLLAVLGTGLARSAVEVGSWEQLTSTTFGRIVIAKLALLLGLAGLGALNRYRSIPRAHESASLLERVSRIEIAVAIAVLALTGILSGVSPGATLLAQRKAAPKPLVVTGADAGTTTRVRLEVNQGFPGRNSYVVTLRDFDSGAAVDAERVSLRFAFLDEPGVGAATAQLVEKTPGTYTGSGTELSLEGRWRVTVVIERGVNSMEIALELSTKSPPQQIEVIPGTPALYNVTLDGGRSVQMYVDPGKAGANELHATFFQDGKAFPGLTDVTLAAARGEGARNELVLRTLDVGHFVASVTLEQGDWRFSVRARAPDGAVLVAHFDQKI